MKVDFDLSNLDLLQDVRLCNNTISSKFCQGLSFWQLRTQIVLILLCLKTVFSEEKVK